MAKQREILPRRVAMLLFVTIEFVCCSCSSRSTRVGVAAAHPTPERHEALPPPLVASDQPQDFSGLHNVVAYHDGYFSGSVPDGQAGFGVLAAWGVKTIISVDGAEPDVASADARGIRYVHLPIGYNGFDEQRKLELARATRDAMQIGPVYIHCHHGKHRSAGAAAAVAVSLGWMSPSAAEARMRVSGTAPSYKGLYACAASAVVLAASVIDAVPPDFPKVSRPSSFVKAMVEIDAALEDLKLIAEAGWSPPANHPDLVPAAVAGHIADLLRIQFDTDVVKTRPVDFAELLRENSDQAQRLEDALVAEENDIKTLDAHLRLVTASCKDCHTRYRD